MLYAIRLIVRAIMLTAFTILSLSYLLLLLFHLFIISLIKLYCFQFMSSIVCMYYLEGLRIDSHFIILLHRLKIIF